MCSSSCFHRCPSIHALASCCEWYRYGSMDGVDKMYGLCGTTARMRLMRLSSSSSSSWSSLEKVLRFSDCVVCTSGGSEPDMVIEGCRGGRALRRRAEGTLVNVGLGQVGGCIRSRELAGRGSWIGGAGGAWTSAGNAR